MTTYYDQDETTSRPISPAPCRASSRPIRIAFPGLARTAALIRLIL